MGRIKKSSKTNWKRIAHPDVEEFLETERERERHNFEAEPDSALFSIDKTPQQVVVPETDESAPLVDLSKLKCFQILKPDSTVPDPLKKRNKVRINPKRVKVSKQSEKTKDTADEPGIVDLWAEEPKKQTMEGAEWISEEVIKHNSKVSKKRKQHKPTELKPIDVPHPGFSINPTFGDHQELLRTAVNAELEAIRREEKLKKATSIPKNAVKDEDMNLESFLGKDDDDEVEIKSEAEDEDKKPVLTRPKTKKQRRKERLAREAQLALAEEKQTRVRESDVFKIKQIKRQIEEQEAQQKARLQKRVEKKILHEKYGQKALSKWKFEDEKVNPLLSDELSGRLIGVKSTSSILLDRFKSFQKRNILEVRVKQRQKRVNRLKKFQRPGDKMEWEITGIWNGIKL